MANTVIRLKKSSISGRSPTTLEHGELAINYTDGKLFYKDDANVIQRISGGANSFMYMNVNSTMLVAGVLADVLTVNAGDNIEINTDALTNKYTITANLFPAFRVANAAFALANNLNNIALVVSNTAPTNPVQGKLWWHNTIGTLFVYYVDQDGTASWVEAVPNGGGVTTGGGGTTDYSPAFNVANAAFGKANTVNTYAYGVAVNANAAFAKANSVNTFAYGVAVNAAAAFNAANNAVTDFSPAFNKANDAYTVANAAYTNANSILTLTQAAFDRANSSNDVLFVAASFDKANSALANTSGVSFNGNLYFPTGNVGIGNTNPGAKLHIAGANTVGGTGYADFLRVSNDSHPGVTNKNKTFRLNSTGTLEVINSAYSSIIFSLNDSGNLNATGTISPGAWTPGQVIKDTMLSNSEVTVVSTTIAVSGSSTNFVTYNYTPVSASSYLLIHYHLSKYTPAGTTDDSWFSQLLVDGNEIAYGWQMVNDNGTGTSGRSGVLFPLMGRYTNSSTSAKQIQVAARRDAADDSITIDNTATSMWLRITEIAR